MKRWLLLALLLLAPSLPELAMADTAAGAADSLLKGIPALEVHAAPGGGQTYTLTLQVLALMTALTLLPALLLMMTSFTRIVVVLSFLKRAMSMQDLPPALITTGFAVFMTIFIMKPVASDIYDQAYLPYVENRIPWQEAAAVASSRMNKFMLSQTREDDVALILELSRTPRPQTALDTPFHITVPAFVLSELRTAFEMGLTLLLPFLVIDLLVAIVLTSLGMMMMPPVVVAMPLKLLVFVAVGGWHLVVESLLRGAM